MTALRAFGAPIAELTETELSRRGIVYQIGVPPGRIDILTELTGLEFADAWAKRVRRRVDGIDADFIGLDDFITNKRAVGRTKDLADIEGLDARE